MLDKLLEEIERLKQSHALLERIYAELDVYNGVTIAGNSDLLRALRNHFHFDDSE